MWSTGAAAKGAKNEAYGFCYDGSSNQDRAICLKEARAAAYEAKRGGLTSPDGSMDRNALMRCDALPAADKEPCRMRIMGAGTTSGSVAGGGLIREVVTPVPTPASTTMPAK